MDPLDGLPYPSLYTWTHIVISSVAVTAVMLIIVTGNSFVIVAIVVDRRLNTLQNWFIVSLAVSDLLVGIFIMPLSLANELIGYWYFGQTMCDLWLATDVLLCTASILNLCLISLDRYWSVARAAEGYSQRRTKRRVLTMIATVWILSVVISLPPLIGWKQPQPTKLGFSLCVLSEEPGYVVYSTVGSFFLPLVIMILVYFRLYQTAVSRARRSLKSIPLPAESSEAAAAAEQRKHCCLDAEVSLCSAFFKLSRCYTLQYRSVSSKGDEFVPEVSARSFPVANKSVRTEAPQAEQLKDACAKTADELELTCLRKPNTGSDDPPGRRSAGCGALLATTDDSTLSCSTGATGIRDNVRATWELGSYQSHCRSKFTLQRACRSAIDKRQGLKSSESELLDQVTLPKQMEGKLELPMIPNEDGPPTKTDMVNHDDITHEETRRKRRKLLKMGSVETAGRHGRRSVVRAREKRATLVLGLVMASFIGCWLPFFSTYVIVSLTSVNVTDTTFAVIFWLGYCNSALNPVIYTIFNRDFRCAFLRLCFRNRFPPAEKRCPL